MSLDVKNTLATYQGLVDSIFSRKIGRNVELYVDDTIIKSPGETVLLKDIKETFKALETYQMKLNPEKCMFGVNERHFPGYYVTSEFIQPSPSRVEQLLEVGSPHSLRDMQGLDGKLTTLVCFISKSVEKAMPHFKMLKGYVEKNNFSWTTEIGATRQQLKETLLGGTLYKKDS